MKIAMIGHKYVPSREGGVEIVVGELATRMAKQGHEVILFNRKRKEYEKITEYNGCKIEEVFTVNNRSLDAIVSSFFATIKAKKMAKKGQLDIIHIHAEGPCNFLWLLGKKHKGYKVVVTIHGLDWQRGKWGGLATKIIKRGEKQAVKYADEIIVLSKNNKQYFRERYHRTTKYIPNGIEVPTLHEPELIAQKYGLSKNSYMLFLARIVPEKGLDYLIDAWKLVKQQIATDKKLVIAGGESHSSDYYQSILKKIEGDDSIIATGFVEGQELQELYSNAYLYVLPSDIEGMPMSLLEALSYGNVCLVSDIPENMEVINEDPVVANKISTDASGYPVHFVCIRENGTFISPRTMQHTSRIIKKEIFSGFDFHSLRHTHAIMLAEAGVEPKYIQTRLGHANIKITIDVYEHTTDTMRDRGRRALNNIFN